MRTYTYYLTAIAVWLGCMLGTQSVFAQTPANDDLCNAVALTVGATCGGVTNGDNTGATPEAGEPTASCFVAGGNPHPNSVWFSFVAPPSGVAVITTNVAIGTNDDTEIAVFDLPGGNCANPADLVELACNQDVDPANFNYLSTIAGANVTPGQTYYVAVSGWQNTEGTFCIEVAEGSALANDDVCSAIGLTVDGTPSATFSNAGATLEAGEATNLIIPGAGGAGNDGWFTGDVEIQASVWFTFVAPASGALIVDLCGQGVTNFDSQVALFEASNCADFTTFTVGAANDDSPGGCTTSNQFASEFFTSCLIPGQTYYMMVDGYNGETGDFQITLTEITAPAFAATPGFTISPNCPGENSGSATLDVTGGFPPYTYAWDNGSTDEVLTGVPAGTYMVTVSDACDSSFTGSITIMDRDALTLDAGATEATVCVQDSVMIGNDDAGSGGRPNISERSFGQDVLNDVFVRHTVEAADLYTTTNPASARPLFAGDFALGAFFALDNDGFLVVIDTSTYTVVQLGASTPVAGHTWTGLAYDEVSGNFYGLSTDGSANQLYTIDISSGAATPVVSVTGMAIPIWLAIDNSGNAYAADIGDDQLYAVNLSTGAAIAIGPLGIDIGFAQDADFDPDTDELYMMAYGAGYASAELRRVNTTTGEASFISEYGGAGEMGAWAIAPESIEPYSYSWAPASGLSDPNSSTTMASPFVTTTYTLTVTDQCGTVASSQDIVVNVVPGPSPAIDYTGDTAALAPIEFMGSNSNAEPTVSWLWTFGDGDSAFTQMASHTYDSAGVYSVCLTTTDATCSRTICEDVTVAEAVSVRDFLSTALSIYPNPAENLLTVDLKLDDAQEVEISLLDVRAKAVMSASLGRTQNVHHELNVSEVGAGVYILRVRTAEGQAFRQVVITH